MEEMSEGNSNFNIPTGFRFTPEPQELLNLLRKKQKGEPIPLEIPITEMPIHGKDAQPPYHIAKSLGLFDNQEELYFFTKAKNISNKGVERVVGEHGRWKTDRTFPILVNNQIVGYMTHLKFEMNNCEKLEPGWLMKEYRMNENVVDAEWVVCRIKRGKSNNNSNNRIYCPTKMASLLQLSYRFKPKDEELVENYLFCIVTGKSYPADVIEEIDVYGDEEPWKIFESRGKSKEVDELYFFSRLKSKCGNGSNDRKKRQVGCGTWLQQGKISQVKNTDIKASKTSFNFSCNNKSTGWIMQEFTLKGKGEWALCTMYYQDNKSDPSPSSSSSSTCNSLKRAAIVYNGDHDLCSKNKRRRIIMCNQDPTAMAFGNTPLIYREDAKPLKELCAPTDGKDNSWDAFTWAQLIGEMGKENIMEDQLEQSNDHPQPENDESSCLSDLVTQGEPQPACAPADNLSSQQEYKGYFMQLDNMVTLDDTITEFNQPQSVEKGIFESLDDIFNVDVDTFFADCPYIG